MTAPRLAMKFHEADISDVEHVTMQLGTVLEQKLDGTRCLTVLTPGSIRFLAHGGQTLKHSAATKHLPQVRRALEAAATGLGDDYEAVLDGELLWNGTGRYVLFDLPYLRIGSVEQVTPATPFIERRGYLDGIGAMLDDGPVSVIRQARTRKEKRALLHDAIEQGAEGLMVKLANSPYQPGKRVRHSLKVKFVKTADVFVTARNSGAHENARLAAYTENDDGSLRIVDVGSCSMIGKPDVPVGTVIEVAYLYWTGTRLYQPRMKRVRSDKTLAECRLDQFEVYRKAVL